MGVRLAIQYALSALFLVSACAAAFQTNAAALSIAILFAYTFGFFDGNLWRKR